MIKIWDSFWPPDMEAILSIPLSLRLTPDLTIWHYDDSSVYTVKSGYRLISESLSLAPSSSLSSTLWKALWGMSVPQKIKVFMWRVVNNTLLTFTAFARRRAPCSTSVLCVVLIKPLTCFHPLSSHSENVERYHPGGPSPYSFCQGYAGHCHLHLAVTFS